MPKKSDASPMVDAYKGPSVPKGGVSVSGKLEAKVSDHGVFSPSKGKTGPDKSPLTDTFKKK